MQCPFHEVGCIEKIARYQFGEHLSFNSEHHLLLVMVAYKDRLVKSYREELMILRVSLDQPSDEETFRNTN